MSAIAIAALVIAVACISFILGVSFGIHVTMRHLNEP
jgi:hypothetical protein